MVHYGEGPCEAELYSLFLPEEVAYISGLQWWASSLHHEL